MASCVAIPLANYREAEGQINKTVEATLGESASGEESAKTPPENRRKSPKTNEKQLFATSFPGTLLEGIPPTLFSGVSLHVFLDLAFGAVVAGTEDWNLQVLPL